MCVLSFGLFEAMSAIEMMDPKMDAGMIGNQVNRKVLNFEQAIKVRVNFLVLPTLSVKICNFVKLQLSTIQHNLCFQSSLDTYVFLFLFWIIK